MRQNSNLTLLSLSNGMKIAHRYYKGVAVDYCGVIVQVGSRDDNIGLEGMAHFVEHTIFKGTERRSSWHILNRMERVGGELNAYTTKEETVVYTAAPSGNLSRAMELIADLVTKSRFPDTELNKEREVVADEINSYLDSPYDAVFDDFEDLIFKNTPLGHNILGTIQSISGIDSSVCRQYLHKWYSAPNMVFFYTGSASPERVKASAERYFSSLPIHTVEHQCLQPGFKGVLFNERRKLELHQSHTVMGAVVGSRYSSDRFALTLLTNILGGPGMNSLLNISLREKRGLVYSVEASTSQMSDTGLFTIYFGCDEKDIERCQDLIRQQLHDLSLHGLDERKLTAAKKQYLGQIAVASENRENMAISTGRRAMYYDELPSDTQLKENIMKITSDDIAKAALSLDELSSLTLS